MPKELIASGHHLVAYDVYLWMGFYALVQIKCKSSFKDRKYFKSNLFLTLKSPCNKWNASFRHFLPPLLPIFNDACG